MKFLQSGLWLCIGALGVSPLCAQQKLTPEQHRQATEALRKALEQPSVAVPSSVEAQSLPPVETRPVAPAAAQPSLSPKALEKARKEAEAKAKADAKAKAAVEKERLAAEERRMNEQKKQFEARRRADEKRYNEEKQAARFKAEGEARARAEAEKQRRFEEEKRAMQLRRESEAKARAQQAGAGIVSPAADEQTKADARARREAELRSQQVPATSSTPAVPERPVSAAPTAQTPAANQTIASPNQDAAAREALRRALDQATDSSTVPPASKTPPPAEPIPSAVPTVRDSQTKDAKTQAAEGARRMEEEKKAAKTREKEAAEARKRTEAEAKKKSKLESKRIADEQKIFEERAKTEAATRKRAAAESKNAPQSAVPMTASATAPVPVSQALPQGVDSAAREAVRRKLDEAEAAAASNARLSVKNSSSPVPTATPAAVKPAEDRPLSTTAPASKVESTSDSSGVRKGQKEIQAALEAEEQKILKAGGKTGSSATPTAPLVETKFPASKSQRLADLLNAYRADRLTPAEYHSQRAKILAE